MRGNGLTMRTSSGAMIAVISWIEKDKISFDAVQLLLCFQGAEGWGRSTVKRTSIHHTVIVQTPRHLNLARSCSQGKLRWNYNFPAARPGDEGHTRLATVLPATAAE